MHPCIKLGKVTQFFVSGDYFEGPDSHMYYAKGLRGSAYLGVLTSKKGVFFNTNSI